MAQTGFTPISNYYSATTTNVPTAGNLVAGELALNTADGKLFYKDSGGVVQTLATKATGSIGGSTTQVQYNNAGALAGSSSFVFDGTNVGIGTSSPACRLDLNRGSAGLLANFTDGVNTNFQISTTSLVATIGPTAGSTTLAFQSNGAERMRVDTSGNLLVGATDGTKSALLVYKAAPSSAYGQICAFSPTAGDSNISGMSIVKYANDSTTAQVLIRFLMNQGSTGQGQINANGANAVAFGSYSDSRLKENISDLSPQLSNICSLRPVEFDYIKSEGGGHQIGFIAQEVKEIYPDLVGEREDGMFTLTDMSKNDARLIKAIQEQQAMIETLTTRLTALENK